jgi:ribosomal protein S8E
MKSANCAKTIRLFAFSDYFLIISYFRIIDIVYNACNHELVRTKTLVKNAIVIIDATPFRQWFESHYALPLGHKKGTKLSETEEAMLNKKRSKKTTKKYAERQKEAKVRPNLDKCIESSTICRVGRGRYFCPAPSITVPSANMRPRYKNIRFRHKRRVNSNKESLWSIGFHIIKPGGPIWYHGIFHRGTCLRQNSLDGVRLFCSCFSLCWDVFCTCTFKRIISLKMYNCCYGGKFK